MEPDDTLRFDDRSRAWRMVQATVTAVLATLVAVPTLAIITVGTMLLSAPPGGILKALKGLADGLISVGWYVRLILVINWKD